MRLIEKLACCLLVVVPLAAAAGCSSGTSDASTTAMAVSGPPPEQSTITVEAVPTADEAGLYVAYDDGFFGQQGLNVKIVPTGGGALTLPDLNGGKAQLVAGNYVSFIQFQVQHQANLRIVANGSLMQPGNQALYVMPGSRIRSVTDLAADHAKIGVNTLGNVGQVLIGALLKGQGLSLNQVSFDAPTKGNPFTDLMNMLKSRNVDVAWLPEPFGTMAEQEFGAVELTDLDQGALTNFPIGCYIGTQKWVAAHPNTVGAFLRALEQGQQIADTNRLAVEQALEKFTQVPPMIADTMTVNSYPLNMNVPMMQRVSDAMYEFGVISRQYNMQKMIQSEPGMVDTGM
jgi:NitT/TauT family transport system substrate-binding protein